MCDDLELPTPYIEDDLTIQSLTQLHWQVRDEIAKRLKDLDDWSRRADLQRVSEPCDKDPAIADAKEIVACGVKMSCDAQDFNPGLDESTKAAIQDGFKQRIERGRQGLSDPSLASELPEQNEQSSIADFLPNIAVKEKVVLANLPTIEQVAQTTELLSDRRFTVNTSDRSAVFHIFAAIAQVSNLKFAITPKPTPEVSRDSWNKSAAFAMANDVVTEGSIMLLGSTCPEHQVKAISLHLRGDFDALESDPNQKRDYIRDVQIKLAAVHGIAPSNVVILGLTKGTITVHYSTKSGITDTDEVAKRSQDQFGPAFVRQEVHASFSFLQINPDVFDQKWNRDFTIRSMCPQGEQRGGFDYTAPAGWVRYGLDVAGKYDNGDRWLGRSNVEGEWPVVFHGTKSCHVKDITETPLQAGSGQMYGYGIYCSPNPATAAEYTDSFSLEDSSGPARYGFMFMCRVNPRAIHHCTHTPCPEARNNQYTLHITQRRNIWFVNCENQSYLNIRPFGLLVKRLDG
jgi:hypothetical protein